MVVTLPPYSMFSQTDVYAIQDGVAFGLMRELVVPDPSDTIFTITQPLERRPDMLSMYFYGTPHLWHVLCTVNNILDPLTGFVNGLKIRVPTKTRLASEGLMNT